MVAVAVVTGAGSGIGAATAHTFAERGFKVVLVDVRGDRANEVAAHLDQYGQSGEPLEVDVSDRDGVEAAMGQVVERYGKIDALVNNAAAFISRGINVTADDWELSLGVNVIGYSNMVQACYEGLLASPAPAVVNVASISAHVAQPNRWTYNATKGAIVTLTKCMALDLSQDGMRVNCVSPGWIWTPEVEKAAGGDRDKWEPIWGRFHMLRRLGEPEEVAQVIAFLCSAEASFVTGANVPVDGGYLALGPEGLGDQSTFAASDQ